MNQLHAAAVGTRLYGDDEWNWRHLVETYSLDWDVGEEALWPPAAMIGLRRTGPWLGAEAS